MTILSLICKKCLKPLTTMDELRLELCIKCDAMQLEGREKYDPEICKGISEREESEINS